MRFILIVMLAFPSGSCNWAKQKTKETVNKTGEVVAKAGSEFADGVSKGVEKTFENDVMLSPELKKDGLSLGKIIINSSDSATDNILTAYFIFDNNTERKITVKVFNENGQEYGRSTKIIKGGKSEARYIDFVFDKRTNIHGKGKITFE